MMGYISRCELRVCLLFCNILGLDFFTFVRTCIGTGSCNIVLERRPATEQTLA